MTRLAHTPQDGRRRAATPTDVAECVTALLAVADALEGRPGSVWRAALVVR